MDTTDMTREVAAAEKEYRDKLRNLPGPCSSPYLQGLRAGIESRRHISEADNPYPIAESSHDAWTFGFRDGALQWMPIQVESRGPDIDPEDLKILEREIERLRAENERLRQSHPVPETQTALESWRTLAEEVFSTLQRAIPPADESFEAAGRAAYEQLQNALKNNEPPGCQPSAEAFQYVDVTAPSGCEGYINLFWRDQVIALVPPPVADEIKEAIDARTEPETRHADDLAVDRFARAMKRKLAKAREKGRGGWDDPDQCSGEMLARMLVEHLYKGNPGNLEDIGNFAMMMHQRGEDPEQLAEAARALPSGWQMMPPAPEGWQLVPVEPTAKMLCAMWEHRDGKPRSENELAAIGYRALLAAAPKPGGGAS